MMNMNETPELAGIITMAALIGEEIALVISL